MTASRRWLVPEVIQTSSMDCGPATLKCVLEGHGIRASYGRLREACQTSVDGTSIDALEDVAPLVGLDAEQLIVPAEHVRHRHSGCLPCIAVTVLPSSATHFVVIWRRLGPWLLIMDPAAGRRWIRADRFDPQLHRHAVSVSSSLWLDWIRSADTRRTLRARLARVGLRGTELGARMDQCLQAPGWRSAARFEAAIRVLEQLAAGGALPRGTARRQLLEHLLEPSTDPARPEGLIPGALWSVDPKTPSDAEQIPVRGVVLLRVGADARAAGPSPDSADVPAELRAALDEAPTHPFSHVLSLLRRDGLTAPLALLLAILAGAVGVLVQALLLRGLLDFGPWLGARGGIAVALAAAFIATLALLERPKWGQALRFARRLDLRLRMALLIKIPRLRDAYFASRLKSDMAERAHAIHLLRRVPLLGAQLLEASAALAFTVAGIGLLDPTMLPLAAAVALGAVVLPLGAVPLLAERDLRLRTHGAALVTYHLDALLGLTAVRTHRAELALRRQHEGLLVEWVRAGLRLQGAAVVVEGLLSLAGFVMAAMLLASHLSRTDHPGSALLLVYWALQVPALGRSVATTMRQYPALRSVILRLVEPLDAPITEGIDQAAEPDPTPDTHGVSIELADVYVERAGHCILEGIDLQIRPGEHVAIVGSSGAGKSTLVGLLLGWAQPASGRLEVDGQPLAPAALARLRRHTAWVDPAVTLWNRSLIDNLRFGAENQQSPISLELLDAARLTSVIERLPQGLQSSLGEGGGSLSGGEGQRVRLGRALLREPVRLAVLDEPFRGLDRDTRRRLLEQLRRRWSSATMLLVSHDVAETRALDRVIVVEDGAVVEQGPPATLAAREDSRYAELLRAEERTHAVGWSDRRWQRWTMRTGALEGHRRGS